MTKKDIDARPLKIFAVRDLPSDWVLREILLAMNDELAVADFLAQLPIFLRLSSLGGAKHRC